MHLRNTALGCHFVGKISRCCWIYRPSIDCCCKCSPLIPRITELLAPAVLQVRLFALPMIALGSMPQEALGTESRVDLSVELSNSQDSLQGKVCYRRSARFEGSCNTIDSWARNLGLSLPDNCQRPNYRKMLPVPWVRD